MEMVKSRNLTSHTYNKKIANDITDKIIQLYTPAFIEFDIKMNSLKP